MPIKVTDPTHPDLRTRLAVINDMVGNFLRNTFRTDPFKSAPHQVQKKMNHSTDAYSVWFSKKEIDALFEANRDKANNLPDGLRIYLAMHGNGKNEVGANLNHPSYKGQYTTVLVCTMDDDKGIHQDLLHSFNSFSTSGGYKGMGADEGTLNPPPYNHLRSGSMVYPVFQ